MNEVIETDVLIIGSGLAGLLAAIKLLESGAKVVLACKTHLSDSNTGYAQGGIAAPENNSISSVESQLEDTIKAGAGLVDRTVAQEIIAEGWTLIETLKKYGVLFDHSANGNYALAREGGHKIARVYHYQDITGKSIANGLVNKIIEWQSSPKRNRQLMVCEHKIACSLIISNGICCGAKFIANEFAKESSAAKDTTNIFAKHVILAAGGIGQIFSRTTNPTIATGDGIALAYQAGAELIDMEFIQFHPTALHLESEADSPAFLISEAVRGAGAILLDKNKNRFMARFHPAGELATRDIVARAIYLTMQETKHNSVFIDLRPIGKKVLEEKFPNILHRLSDFGIDALKEPVPVSPAAHYFMGGIKAQSDGRTSIPSLYAIGECASTGLHGANRLASNSLLEAGVMALKVANFISQQKDDIRNKLGSARESSLTTSYRTPSDLAAVRKCMTQDAGISRNAESLGRAMNLLGNNLLTSNCSGQNIQAANIMLLARIIANCAQRRAESRGSHFRTDYPELSNKFVGRQTVQKDIYSWINLADIKTAVKG